MAKSASDLITLSRQKSNTEKSKFVSDAEVLIYVNEGRTVLRDLVIKADPSYYQSQVDLVFNSPANAPAGSAALPVDIYKIRGLTQNPDTPRRRPIFSLAFADRDQRRDGYTLDGDFITFQPYQLTGRGTIRLYYTPKLKPLASPTSIDVETASISIPADGTVTGFSTGSGPAQFFAVNNPFLTTDVGNVVAVAGAVNSDNNGQFTVASYDTVGQVAVSGAHTDENLPTSAIVTLLRKSRVDNAGNWTFYGDNPTSNSTIAVNVGDVITVTGTPSNDGSYAVTQAATGGNAVVTAGVTTVAENFPGQVTVSVQAANTVPTLDVTLDNFDSFISTFAANRIATKAQKNDLVQLLGQQLGADEARVSEMAADRAGEPEAAPVLWHPSGNAFNPWGGGGWE